ncbi:MAG TPA: caspase family protein, partial [Amaricoccus sp.]|nr:caspase family protein [Amaricoccus sp.]
MRGLKTLERTAWLCRDRLRSRRAGLPRAARLAAALCLCLLALATAAAAETRVALVIGNGAYENLEPLNNPVNDASDISDSLEGLGFEVMHGTNLSRDGMIALIGDFLDAASTADVSLFYYAGHGFQIDGLNYLVPVDARLKSREDISERTIRLDQITDELAGSPGIHLVFLDACRNNPLSTSAPSLGAARDGLARVGDAAGFLFAFATQPDNVAYDGVGRNSFFAQALLGHLNTPGQDIASTMIAVRRDVLAATGGNQVPWENSSLTRQFEFAPGDGGAAPETLLWQVAATARDPALMRIYLDRYPDGPHVADVQAFLDDEDLDLPPSIDTSAARDLPPPSESAALSESLWEVARRTRLRPLVEAYVQHNPDGTHVEEARRMLADLPRPDDPNAAPELVCERLATHDRDGTANVAGVPMPRLREHAAAAVEACSAAAAANPEMPHYTALLARAEYAAGDREAAIGLYRDAADRGDLRAMTSLGLLVQSGEGVPKDLAAAAALYGRAADGGLPDGAINLAVMLISGEGVAPDVGRAAALLERASADGSAIATYNLGVLAERGVSGDDADAIRYFTAAAALGEPRGYLPAGFLLDQGRGQARDPESAADLLLRGVASDSGEAYQQLTRNGAGWSPETIRA